MKRVSILGAVCGVWAGCAHPVGAGPPISVAAQDRPGCAVLLLAADELSEMEPAWQSLAPHRPGQSMRLMGSSAALTVAFRSPPSESALGLCQRVVERANARMKAAAAEARQLLAAQVERTRQDAEASGQAHRAFLSEHGEDAARQARAQLLRRRADRNRKELLRLAMLDEDAARLAAQARQARQAHQSVASRLRLFDGNPLSLIEPSHCSLPSGETDCR